MISGLTLNRNQTQILFDSLVDQLVYSSVISSEDVIIGGLKIEIVATHVLVNSSRIGSTMVLTHSHFLNNLLRIYKNYKFNDVIPPCQF